MLILLVGGPRVTLPIQIPSGGGGMEIGVEMKSGVKMKSGVEMKSGVGLGCRMQGVEMKQTHANVIYTVHTHIRTTQHHVHTHTHDTPPHTHLPAPLLYCSKFCLQHCYPTVLRVARGRA